MRIIFTLLFIAFAFPATAEVISKPIEYKDGETTLKGTIAYNDEISSLKPGIVIYPEWWGQNDYVKRRAHEIASQGYVVITADMYGEGKVTRDPKQAEAWSKEIYADRDLMKRRARAAIHALQSQVNVDKSKTALIGFCMGGTVALDLARAGEPILGVAAFHSAFDFTTQPKEGDVKARILVMNGAADPFIKPGTTRQFITEMEAAKATYQLIHYSGAEHAYTNPDANSFGIEGVKYNPEAERYSFQQLRLFFAEIFKN